MKGICARLHKSPRPNDRWSSPSVTRQPLDSSLTGGKAAALARGRVAGLSSLPGVVLTTAFSDAVDAGADVATHDAVREAFDQAGGDQRALVARSSSVVEDMATSSMAGQFESVIGISGFEAFVDGGDGRARSRGSEPEPPTSRSPCSSNHSSSRGTAA